MLLLAIGKATEACAVLDADAGDGMERDEGLRILAPVVVAALHECALRISVANLQVGADGRDEVAQNLLADCVILKHK